MPLARVYLLVKNHQDRFCYERFDSSYTAVLPSLLMRRGATTRARKDGRCDEAKRRSETGEEQLRRRVGARRPAFAAARGCRLSGRQAARSDQGGGTRQAWRDVQISHGLPLVVLLLARRSGPGDALKTKPTGTFLFKLHPVRRFHKPRSLIFCALPDTRWLRRAPLFRRTAAAWRSQRAHEAPGERSCEKLAAAPRPSLFRRFRRAAGKHAAPCQAA